MILNNILELLPQPLDMFATADPPSRRHEGAAEGQAPKGELRILTSTAVHDT